MRCRTAGGKRRRSGCEAGLRRSVRRRRDPGRLQRRALTPGDVVERHPHAAATDSASVDGDEAVRWHVTSVDDGDVRHHPGRDAAAGDSVPIKAEIGEDVLIDRRVADDERSCRLRTEVAERRRPERRHVERRRVEGGACAAAAADAVSDRRRGWHHLRKQFESFRLCEDSAQNMIRFSYIYIYIYICVYAC